MNRFKHSGTLGDIVYSLPIMKHFGGGAFYLHLNQIDWIGQYYYGSKPNPFHQGRMTAQDLEFMRDFMLAQDYIKEFAALDPQTTEITHNLDQFRPLFVGHPGNYVDIYASAFKIDPTHWADLRNQPWLTVPDPRPIAGRPYVINRTARWNSSDSLAAWQSIRDQAQGQAVFVGLPEEHQEFCRFTDWAVDYQPTKNMLELAQIIAGSEQFVGNQSVALSLAIGLGVEWACELRRDLPQERNECWFPLHPMGNYF